MTTRRSFLKRSGGAAIAIQLGSLTFALPQAAGSPVAVERQVGALLDLFSHPLIDRELDALVADFMQEFESAGLATRRTLEKWLSAADAAAGPEGMSGYVRDDRRSRISGFLAKSDGPHVDARPIYAAAERAGREIESERRGKPSKVPTLEDLLDERRALATREQGPRVFPAPTPAAQEAGRVRSAIDLARALVVTAPGANHPSASPATAAALS